MITARNSLLVYKGYHIEAPNETPSCGIIPELAYTIVNTRYCLIYVWLYNKNEFWFFPINHNDFYIDGYIWNQLFWVKTRIRIDTVKSYSC